MARWFFEFLATETEVPESECKRMIWEILIAVSHLHDNNLLHRDIKPENIMSTPPLAETNDAFPTRNHFGIVLFVFRFSSFEIYLCLMTSICSSYIRSAF